MSAVQDEIHGLDTMHQVNRSNQAPMDFGYSEVVVVWLDMCTHVTVAADIAFAPLVG